MLVFSYGSNMCFYRLKERVSSVEFVSIARLPNYCLKFHKVSKDGSGKANVFKTGDEKDFVLGVLCKIDDREIDCLDKAEGAGRYGKGYCRKNVMVKLFPYEGENVDALVYVANPDYIDESLQPYKWYMDFILTGTVDYGFPSDYIKKLETIETKIDLDDKRVKENEATLAKHKASMTENNPK